MTTVYAPPSHSWDTRRYHYGYWCSRACTGRERETCRVAARPVISWEWFCWFCWFARGKNTSRPCMRWGDIVFKMRSLHPKNRWLHRRSCLLGLRSVVLPETDKFFSVIFGVFDELLAYNRSYLRNLVETDLDTLCVRLESSWSTSSWDVQWLTASLNCATTTHMTKLWQEWTFLVLFVGGKSQEIELLTGSIFNGVGRVG